MGDVVQFTGAKKSLWEHYFSPEFHFMENRETYDLFVFLVHAADLGLTLEDFLVIMADPFSAVTFAELAEEVEREADRRTYGGAPE